MFSSMSLLKQPKRARGIRHIHLCSLFTHTSYNIYAHICVTYMWKKILSLPLPLCPTEYVIWWPIYYVQVNVFLVIHGMFFILQSQPETFVSTIIHHNSMKKIFEITLVQHFDTYTQPLLRSPDATTRTWLVSL